MSAVTLLPALKEKPSEESQQNGPNLSGLDESGGGGSGGVGGGGDPAVLAVGPARRPLTYTREELVRLRNSPLVKRGLENAFAGCEALALVLKKRSDSPNEDDRGARGDAPNENHKGVYGRERERRPADPRERVRKESESSSAGGGIVLSPQRRSFTSGCGAPAAGAAPPPHLARTRPASPLSQPPQKTAEQAGRRIGSGRIMVRDEAGRAGGREEGEYRSTAEPYRPPATRGEHARSNNERFDRRSFGRDSFSSDMKRERDDRFNNDKNHRDDNRRSGGRFSQRRFEKEDEPEWFSGGPTSQLETIELRGFDEPIKKNGSANSSGKENDRWNNSGGGGGGRSPTERWRAEPEPAPQPQDDSLDTTNDKESGVETKCEEPPAPQSVDPTEFNLDDFLKFDTIPDVLTNGSSETEGSRFSRWFRRDSPTNDTRHFERIMNNMVDDLDKSTRIDPPPPETSHVFAPISPVAPVGMPMGGMAGMAGMPRPPAPPPSLLELLRRANANPDTRPANNYIPEMNSMGTKIHSLEELEARLRPQHSAPHAGPAPEPDMSAFKRLMAQVSGGHAIAADSRVPQQPMSLIQMLNKSVEAAQKAAAQQQHQQQQQQQQQAPHIPQDLVVKLLQVQQQQQQQQQQRQQQAMNELGLTSSDRDLLQRPEAQAIIHGLKAGEITAQHLMQQLSNPGMQSRHREVLLTILRLHQQRQMGGSPLPGGMGAPPHLVIPPNHQPLRISPLPSVPARIPSPRELAAHTQSIMQGALIKKKLEEQRENYRRRHEQPPKQPTPISFTPTSVLRKMTAEKESEAPSPKHQQQWGPHKLPQGRPIVKGNQSGVATYTEYPQHYMSQPPQMVSGSRSFPHQQQQRQQVPNNYNNMNMGNMNSVSNMGNMNNVSNMGNMSNMNSVSNMGNMNSMSNMRGMPAGTTLHQLLVQSHQRNINEIASNGAGGGDNQLARWFSPELLARASAGKLPSVHVPNALSLEDLERHHHSPAPPLRN